MKIRNQIDLTGRIGLVTMMGTFLLVFLLILGFNPRYGFLESTFALAPESRLPKWVQLPPGYTRADVSATLALYSGPYLFGLGDAAKFVLCGPAPEHKKLLVEKIRARWHKVTAQEENRNGNYDFSPQYYAASHVGIDDIIEFKCTGPLFWMVDKVKTKTQSPGLECRNVNASQISKAISSCW